MRTRKEKEDADLRPLQYSELIDYSVVILVNEHRNRNNCSYYEEGSHRIEVDVNGIIYELLYKISNADTACCSGDNHFKILTKNKSDNCKNNCNTDGNGNVTLGKSGDLNKEECVNTDVISVKTNATNINEVVYHSGHNSGKNAYRNANSVCRNGRNELSNEGSDPMNGCNKAYREEKNNADKVGKSSAKESDNKAYR